MQHHPFPAPVREPHPGEVVMVRAAPAQNNGRTEAPAIVTSVGNGDGRWMVDVRVLLGGVDIVPAKTSVPLYADRAAVESAGLAPVDTHVAWWPPPRV